MSNKNLTIDLKRRTDKDGRLFYVGKIKAPVLIDCSQGAVFLVFVSDQDDEQLQVALMDDSTKED